MAGNKKAGTRRARKRTSSFEGGKSTPAPNAAERELRRVEGDDPKAVINHVDIAGITFDILGSVIDTVRAIDQRAEPEVLTAYRVLTDDGDPSVDPEAARAVVKGAVQEEWYRATNRTVPERVINNQRERIMAAKTRKRASGGTATATRKKGRKSAAKSTSKGTAAAAAEGNGRVTKVSVIRSLLTQRGANADVDKIVEAAQKQVTSSVTRKDVVWNRNRMIEAGELDAPKE